MGLPGGKGAAARARAAPVTLVVLAVAGGLAALSLLVPSAPTTDPWGWLVWGRQLSDMALDTSGGGAPSWKPLPVLFTTPLSLAGDAAPQLWLVASRACALIALWPVFVLGRRLAGLWAGCAAALVLAMSDGWLRGVLHGYTEPAVVALLAGAVELHLRDRRRAALLAIAAAGLARPEAWLVLAGYAVWLGRREPRARPLAAVALAATPAAWFGGDMLGSGNAFHAGQSAQALSRAGGLDGADLIGGAFGGEMLAVVALALAGVALAKDRLSLVLAGLGAGWAVLVVGLVALGYPASERFMAPAVAAVCILGGAGAVRMWSLGWPDRRIRLAVCAGLAVGAVALTVVRVERGADLVDAAVARAELQGGLRATVHELGRNWLLACGPPVLPHDLHWNEGALAWELDVPLRRVREISVANAVAGGRSAVILSPRPMSPPPEAGAGTHLRVVARSGRWRAYAPPGTPAASRRCTGAARARASVRAATRPGPG